MSTVRSAYDSHRSSEDSSSSQEINVEIPSLKTLALNKIKEKDPKLFFSLYDQKEFSNDIKEQMNAAVESIKEQHLADYLQAKEDRKEKIKGKVSLYRQDNCLVQWIGFFGGASMSGLYLGIGSPLIDAMEASVAARCVFYTFTAIPFLLGACGGLCLSNKIIKIFAECCIKGPSNHIEIDLDIEAARQQKELDDQAIARPGRP